MNVSVPLFVWWLKSFEIMGITYPYARYLPAEILLMDIMLDLDVWIMYVSF